MIYFLFVSLVVSSEKQVEVRYTETAPRLDGVLEDIWQQADSAYDFVQFDPYEKESPTERTVVYVLQDGKNLYVAFVCYAEKNEPIACFTKDEDYVILRIDPFGSKTSGYYFWVYASQIQWDGWILDDGHIYDDSWEGIWYRAVKLYEDRFIVEMKIPFKSIRYKKGLNQWGIQFTRYIAFNSETDHWTEVLQIDGDRVSKWASLVGINPQVTGHYFELYPEAYVRYDRRWFNGADSTVIKPSMSFNVKWDPTPQTTINATAYPDFAQIESDPFTLNLSRYPTYLSERRPFFLEGNDIFRLSQLGDFSPPLELFYSRRIGKSMNGTVIPILGGLKVTSKSKDWNFGMLGAYTDDYTDQDSLIEPNRGYGALRIKRKILNNSDIGLLASGTVVNEDNYNYALGLDLAYRQQRNSFNVQGGFSDHRKKMGWATMASFQGFIKDLFASIGVEAIHDSFDVSEIGFVPWSGRQRFRANLGPYKTYSKGFLKNLYVAPGVNLIREQGNENISKGGSFTLNPNFRNNWGFNLFLYGGSQYEADTNYFNRSVELSIWGRLFGQHLNLGGHYEFDYNYVRGYPAYHGSNWFTYNYSIIAPLSVGLSANIWTEWDTLNNLIGITEVVRPNVFLRPQANLFISLFNECVMMTPGKDLGKTDLLANRIGLLLSWNFQPKSWLYIALNDYRTQDQQGQLQPQYQIGAIKVKYLLYF